MKGYTMREAVLAAKRAQAIRVLLQVNGHVKDAAEILEIGESTLHRLMVETCISDDERFPQELH